MAWSNSALGQRQLPSQPSSPTHPRALPRIKIYPYYDPLAHPFPQFTPHTTQDAANASPASLASAITVGASNTMDNKEVYSNYGSLVDIYAPGGK